MSAILTLELPADVLLAARMTLDEVKMELAVALFRLERLSLGRAGGAKGVVEKEWLDPRAGV